MTLHEAIEKVLIETKRKITAKELAEIINEQQLYKRQDNTPVTASQIISRISNYDSIFIYRGGLVSLKGLDHSDLVEAEIQRDLMVVLENSRYAHGVRENHMLSIILQAISTLDKKKESEDSEELGAKFLDENELLKNLIPKQGNLIEIFKKVIRSIQHYPNRNRILQKIPYWLNPDRNMNGTYMLPEYLCSIIGGLDLYSGRIMLRTHQNLLNNFKLNIFENNSASTFSHNYIKEWEDDNITKQNTLLLDVSSINKLSFLDDNRPIFKVGIYTPPWNKINLRNEWSSNFSMILNEIEGLKTNRVQKALLIVPESANYGGGKDLIARKYLTDRNFVDCVISIPFYSPRIAIKSISLIIFDFNKKSDEVLLADFNQIENFDVHQNWDHIVTVLNEKQEIHHVSKKINIKEIELKDYSWLPTRYIFDTQSLLLKENHKSFLLGDLLAQIKKGYNVDKQKLYEGGEVKYLKTSNLDQENIYLQLNDGLLGLDPDEFDKPIESFKDSIVVSFVGSQLKPTLIPDDKLFVFNHNLAILTLNTNLVLPEFLALELKEGYVEQ